MTREEYFMQEAIEEAKKAYSLKETPIGAVIVLGEKIVARGYNRVETSNCASYHAEMLAIKRAAELLGRWRLYDCEMYVTMEPCFMCSGAIVLSRIKKLYIGALHNKNKKVDKHNEFQREYLADSGVEISYGLMEEECSKMLSNFFRERRNEKNK